jgi:ADP-L-glycero-D-manno-heptose 6-epimerase
LDHKSPSDCAGLARDDCKNPGTRMIAITGGAGFIGSNLAHRLAGRGRELMLVDHPLSAAKSANLAGLSGYRLVTDSAFLDELRSDRFVLDAVFHLGARSRMTETDWPYLADNNVRFSQALWTSCARRGCPFYYASSSATYGDGAIGFDDRTPPEQLKPVNLYGKSKNDFDQWVLTQVEEGNLAPPAWAGLKFFNVYGPREGHKGASASVIWRARRQILETGEASLFRSYSPGYADGGQKRDFVFVEDCLDHLLWLSEHEQVCGIFNSATGLARSYKDLAMAVFAALGREPRIRFVDMPPDLISQYQNFTQADMSKLRAAGFTGAGTPLEAGVRRAILAQARLDDRGD